MDLFPVYIDKIHGDVIFVDHYQTNKLVTTLLAGSIILRIHLYNADENARKCYLETTNSFKNKFKSIKFNTLVVCGEINSYHLITSKGPATAIEFALKLLSH
ncbi:unnamed protein product [Rotaria sp. Silwood1]|nr:unnamed protein product [Rotaria sp. Silwood1]CAF3605810.1 unnamed protein product [Rotaria sp. Silwood1]CAF3626274.1 unnamed protein product [Rotaria sp. Silwood1]CAF4705159.1 unnamed protein product [Rotaria sp. Silwood1]CAF4804067.1 unnamed protein product [Rotaria sp. Silwood1]